MDVNREIERGTYNKGGREGEGRESKGRGQMYRSEFLVSPVYQLLLSYNHKIEVHIISIVIVNVHVHIV